jgi:hypothetical protein
MGALLWIGYIAAAIVVIAIVVCAGLLFGTILACAVILALAAVAIFLVASLMQEIAKHIFYRRKRRA